MKNLSKKQQGILFAVIMLVLVGVVWGKKLLHSKSSAQAVTAQNKAPEPDDPSIKKINILFIGNNQTSSNDMPKTLMAIASADKDAKIKLNVKFYCKPNASLLGDWQQGEAIRMLKSEKWDYVILQENNLWAMDDVHIKETHTVANSFNREILNSGARTVLFQDVANNQGNTVYKDMKYALNLRNPQFMQQLLDGETKQLANELNAPVVPVGDYWAYALQQNPQLKLYSVDGGNPNPAGSFFTALLFYRYLTGRTFEQLAFATPGVDPNTTSILKSLASFK